MGCSGVGSYGGGEGSAGRPGSRPGKESDGFGAGSAGGTACLGHKRPYLDYATALARGWPIATGVIEGACRHLIKDRLDITGARWSLPGAEAVLKLRALISNGDVEPYYTWHLQREHQRNLQARYLNKLSLAA